MLANLRCTVNIQQVLTNSPYCTIVPTYHCERPHLELSGKVIDPLPQDEDGNIIEFEQLGGLLRSYRRVKTAA